MKTYKHGNGMTHEQVVKFSNRLALLGQVDDKVLYESETIRAFNNGWEAACKYFAHELRVALREIECSTLNN